MRFYHLYEGESQEQEQGLLNDDNSINKSKKNTNNNNLVYRYDWLIDGDIQNIQNKIIDFVNSKKKDGMSSKGINNYISPLERFYRIAGIKGIDWDLVKSCRPEDVKKTQDREYNAEEVIAIEEKLDVRGKVVSGVMRGSGIRRGAVKLISVRDLFQFQTKYGKAGIA